MSVGIQPAKKARLRSPGAAEESDMQMDVSPREDAEDLTFLLDDDGLNASDDLFRLFDSENLAGALSGDSPVEDAEARLAGLTGQVDEEDWGASIFDAPIATDNGVGTSVGAHDEGSEVARRRIAFEELEKAMQAAEEGLGDESGGVGGKRGESGGRAPHDARGMMHHQRSHTLPLPANAIPGMARVGNPANSPPPPSIVSEALRRQLEKIEGISSSCLGAMRPTPMPETDPTIYTNGIPHPRMAPAAAASLVVRPPSYSRAVEWTALPGVAGSQSSGAITSFATGKGRYRKQSLSGPDSSTWGSTLPLTPAHSMSSPGSGPGSPIRNGDTTPTRKDSFTNSYMQRKSMNDVIHVLRNQLPAQAYAQDKKLSKAQVLEKTVSYIQWLIRQRASLARQLKQTRSELSQMLASCQCDAGRQCALASAAQASQAQAAAAYLSLTSSHPDAQTSAESTTGSGADQLTVGEELHMALQHLDVPIEDVGMDMGIGARSPQNPGPAPSTPSTPVFDPDVDMGRLILDEARARLDKSGFGADSFSIMLDSAASAEIAKEDDSMRIDGAAEDDDIEFTDATGKGW
ncbi:hypothetical protein BDK51DRAFT_40949 [Blyttiomyces helicus]|uniref:BHLH domain-containing protein n=1 Tax=Blyttiomyces helicus TaxID=388810 RepID=A0A4P9WLX7_9FUNG|nr:hypothetical protein BDK51DRAFT_40949 [Blyttiomyces helicus]|eukprot:RKO92150.1 hypothetical protein BDK51DRAFT_40949 [Blyttiomyces helicus]